MKKLSNNRLAAIVVVSLCCFIYFIYMFLVSYDSYDVAVSALLSIVFGCVLAPAIYETIRRIQEDIRRFMDNDDDDLPMSYS